MQPFSLIILAAVCWAAPLATRADDSVVAQWIAFDQLAAADRAVIESVTRGYTLRREYPARQFAGNLRQFEFLLDHMLATSVIAEQAGLIQYRVTRDAAGRHWADNRQGARGFLLPVSQPLAGHRLFYVEGSREGVFEARGRGVTAVRYAQPAPDLIELSGAVLVKVENKILAMMAQLFQVFLRRTVDENFEHVLRQPVELAKLALADPARLRAIIESLQGADRELAEPFRALLPADD